MKVSHALIVCALVRHALAGAGGPAVIAPRLDEQQRQGRRKVANRSASPSVLSGSGTSSHSPLLQSQPSSSLSQHSGSDASSVAASGPTSSGRTVFMSATSQASSKAAHSSLAQSDSRSHSSDHAHSSHHSQSQSGHHSQLQSSHHSSSASGSSSHAHSSAHSSQVHSSAHSHLGHPSAHPSQLHSSAHSSQSHSSHSPAVAQSSSSAARASASRAPSLAASSGEEFNILTSSAASSVSTLAPTTSYTAGVFGGGSTNVIDLLDPSYDAFTDDNIWLTATGFPPTNDKTRNVAGITSGSSGSGMPSASGPMAASTPSQTAGTALTKRVAIPGRPTVTHFVTTKYATSYLALGTGTCPTIVGITKVASTTSVTSWPAPSRSSVACTAAPSTFAGTAQGFKDLCNGVRYCDPPAVKKYKTSSLTGEVTRSEIESLLGQLQNVGSVLETGVTANTLSTGYSGQGAYGSGLLFEVTGDIRALDNAVRIADNILFLRNNPKTGRIMWTGKRELIWPTKPKGGFGQYYAGSEQMSIIGNMVGAAIYILRNPCLWSMKPQWTNAPTSFNRSSTYLDRAKAYVAAADQTVDSYFRPWFFNPHQLMIQPNSTLYSKAQDFPPGTYMPWNRRALMLHGLIRLATAHELAPIQDPVRVARYDALAAANVRDFVNTGLYPTKSRGHQTYVWYYAKSPPGGTIEMVRGVHGFYDIWGAWLAWQRGIANDTLTETVMQNLANTMQYQIYSDDSDKLFAAYVNGYANLCDVDEQPILYLWGSYAYFAKWIPRWYTAVADAGQAQLGLTWVTAPLFWAKAALHRNSTSFWHASAYT